MILDCCYAAKAFAREHIGKRKFELLTSAAHDLVSPAPHLPHSFTTTLYQCLKRLIKENPKGFSTSHLYREVYHTMPIIEPPKPSNPKPLLFDQARYSFGKIWLRPQVVTDRPPRAKEEGRYLKLKFRLNANPDLAVMNELAVHLQFLPHVDQISFEDLYAPKEQITDFMKLILQAKKIRPLIRKIHAKRQLRKIAELKSGENGTQAPSSLLKLTLDHDHHPAYDWSSAAEVSHHHPKKSEHFRDPRKQSETWPPVQAMNSSFSGGELSAEYKMDVSGPGTLISTFVPQVVNTMQEFPQGQNNGAIRPSSHLLNPRGKDNSHDGAENVAHDDTGSVHDGDRRKRPRSKSLDREATPEKKKHNSDQKAAKGN